MWTEHQDGKQNVKVAAASYRFAKDPNAAGAADQSGSVGLIFGEAVSRRADSWSWTRQLSEGWRVSVVRYQTSNLILPRGARLCDFGNIRDFLIKRHGVSQIHCWDVSQLQHYLGVL